jgi:hypothetical protein
VSFGAEDNEIVTMKGRGGVVVHYPRSSSVAGALLLIGRGVAHCHCECDRQQDGGLPSRFSASNGAVCGDHRQAARGRSLAARRRRPSQARLSEGQCTERSVRVVTPAAKLSPV